MARTAKPLTELLNGVSAVVSSLQSQETVAYSSNETQKADVKVLDQLARAIRKLPVAETVQQ